MAVFAELCDIVEETIDLYRQEGKELPQPTDRRGRSARKRRGPGGLEFAFRKRRVASIAKPVKSCRKR
jgi:hypothetical protein